MLDDDQIARLREIAGRFFELDGSTLLGSSGPPFDVTKPNFHDTKADFLAEVAYVDQLLETCEGLSETLAAL